LSSLVALGTPWITRTVSIMDPQAKWTHLEHFGGPDFASHQHLWAIIEPSLNMKTPTSIDLHSDERKWQPHLVQNLVPFHWHTEPHASGEKNGAPSTWRHRKSRWI
jgi:hypothetical protein